MRISLIAAAVTSLIAGALLAGPVTAAGPAKTSVKIEAEVGGFFGSVSSPRVQKCASGRKVFLWKQKGSTQKPANDLLIGTDIAQANGDGYMWSINTTKQGKFYARTAAKPLCKSGSSPTVHSEAP